jgi:replicative DNA helicase
MGAPLVFQRLIQKHSGLSSKKIFEMYKSNDPKIRDVETEVTKQYRNVKFCFKPGSSVEDIKENIIKQQEASGEKIRLVVIDYLECISGPYSDSTANTAMIAQKLKDVANELEICILLLLQPQKHAGDPSAELLSYRNIKGSSAVEQAASVVFTLWRAGFSPKNPEDDKYMTVAVVKNRMGGLGAFDFSWNGLTGDIEELDELQKGELDALRKKRASEKAASDLL